MNSCVYCLYSTEDGTPRYVGRASEKVSYDFKRHVTAALDREPGVLYDWMRDVWRGEYDVAVHTLEEGIELDDLDLFERYWIEQFAGLLNGVNVGDDKRDTPVALQIRTALRAQCELSRQAN